MVSKEDAQVTPVMLKSQVHSQVRSQLRHPLIMSRNNREIQSQRQLRLLITNRNARETQVIDLRKDGMLSASSTKIKSLSTVFLLNTSRCNRI